MRVPRRVLMLLVAGGVVGLCLMNIATTSDTLDAAVPEPAPVPAAAVSVTPLSTALLTTTTLPPPPPPTTTTANTQCRLEHAASRPVGTRMREAVQTFPMQGWMSWAEYQCETNCNKEGTRCIDENLFLHVAREFVRLGLRDAGYNYIWIDDCWMLRKRTANGMEADPTRFPHGIKWLADQLHGMGLKLGIYLNNGKWTCQHYAGSEGYLTEDVKTIAAWEVDGLKLDGCYMTMNTFNRVNDSYAEASAAIRASNRPMVFICSYPYYVKFGGGMAGLPPGGTPDFKNANQICDTFRFMDDVNLPPADGRLKSIMNFMGTHYDEMLAYTGPGHWSDPDMLLLGSKLTEKYSISLQKVQLVVWIMVAAPLLTSMDPLRLSDEMLALLLNEKLMQLHRDPLVQAAHREDSVKVVKGGGRAGQLWIKPLADGTVAAAFVNFDKTKTLTLEAPLSSFGGFHPGAAAHHCKIGAEEILNPDDYAHTPGQIVGGSNFQVEVPPYDVRLFRVSASVEVVGT